MTAWWDGPPSKEGTYLVAWEFRFGDEVRYQYEVHIWKNGEWYSLPYHRDAPKYYSEISSPLEQDMMLEELHKQQ